MRLWSLHPKYLDSKGLAALWREALLAQNVLLGNTKGYTNHPQLLRFKAAADPIGAIACYLACVADEADRRGYNFNRSKIAPNAACPAISVTTGQLAYERTHLLNKLKVRDPERHDAFSGTEEIELHPLFRMVEGDVEAWEVVHL